MADMGPTLREQAADRAYSRPARRPPDSVAALNRGRRLAAATMRLTPGW